MRIALVQIMLMFSINAMSQKTTFDSLQGYWQSEEDSKYVIQFVGRNEISFYDKQRTNSAAIILGDSCIEDMSVNSSSLNGNFLMAIDKDSNLCYSINDLTDNHLTLMYQARGNLLLFKRIKQVR